MKRTILIFSLILWGCNLSAQYESASVYTHKADSLLQNGEVMGAFEMLSQGMIAHPDSTRLYDMRGSLLVRALEFELGLKDFEYALTTTSDSLMQSHLYTNRGGVKVHLMDYQGAYADLKLAIALDANNIDALNNLAAVCDEVGKPEETIGYLLEIIEVDSTYAPAYVNLGFKYQVMEDHITAIEYFDKCVAIHPDEPLGYSNRSYSKLKTNDTDGALKDINRSLALWDINSYAYKIRALIYIESGKTDLACKDLQIAIELNYTKQFGDEVEELISRYCQ